MEHYKNIQSALRENVNEDHHALLVSKGYHKVSDEGGMFNDEEVYHHKTKPAAIHAGVTNGKCEVEVLHQGNRVHSVELK